jgi:uncharacterized protein (DUF305 family)
MDSVSAARGTLARTRLRRVGDRPPPSRQTDPPAGSVKRARFHPLTLAAALMAAVAVAACGGDDTGGGEATARDTEGAFLEAMIPHHESAIEMARLAKRRAGHRQITALADAIIETQSREIRQIERIHRRLFGRKVLPNADAHQGLGLSATEAGMAHDDPAAKLARARPFDRAFIDEMIGHHQGAIRMARVVREQTEDEEVRSLASAIVSAQSREIERMKRWRTAWYGAPSPSGDIPQEPDGPGDSNEEHEGDHMG